MVEWTKLISLSHSSPILRQRNLKTQLHFYRLDTHLLRKRNFLKTLLRQVELENASFSFSCGCKTFENEVFRKRWRHGNHVISLPECSSNTNPKWPGDCRLDFRHSLVSGLPSPRRTAGRVSGKPCLWRRFIIKFMRRSWSPEKLPDCNPRL